MANTYAQKAAAAAAGRAAAVEARRIELAPQIAAWTAEFGPFDWLDSWLVREDWMEPFNGGGPDISSRTSMRGRASEPRGGRSVARDQRDAREHCPVDAGRNRYARSILRVARAGLCRVAFRVAPLGRARA